MRLIQVFIQAVHMFVAYNVVILPELSAAYLTYFSVSGSVVRTILISVACRHLIGTAMYICRLVC